MRVVQKGATVPYGLSASLQRPQWSLRAIERTNPQKGLDALLRAGRSAVSKEACVCSSTLVCSDNLTHSNFDIEHVHGIQIRQQQSAVSTQAAAD